MVRFLYAVGTKGGRWFYFESTGNSRSKADGGLPQLSSEISGAQGVFRRTKHRFLVRASGGCGGKNRQTPNPLRAPRSLWGLGLTCGQMLALVWGARC